MKRTLRLLLLVGAMGSTAPLALAQDDEGATEPPAAAAAAPAPAPVAAQVNPLEQQFGQQLGTAEEHANTLKEQVFRSKATLQLLKEIVIQGANTGSRSAITHVNRLGNSYRVESVAYYLDGQSIYARFDPSGGLDETTEIEVWEGAIPPGQHELTVSMVLRGNGFRVFNYVEGYSFKVQSNYTFTAEDGHATALSVVVDEKKGFGVPYTEKPKVEFELNKVQLVADQ